MTIAAVNAAGAPTIGDTHHYWAAAFEEDAEHENREEARRGQAEGEGHHLRHEARRVHAQPTGDQHGACRRPAREAQLGALVDLSDALIFLVAIPNLSLPTGELSYAFRSSLAWSPDGRMVVGEVAPDAGEIEIGGARCTGGIRRPRR